MEMHVPEKYYFEPNINKKTGLCLERNSMLLPIREQKLQ
jgi:hypothetical protein